MKKAGSHPRDFSPYLDGDASDRSYDRIRRHLEECPNCRNEVRELQALDGMFRSTADEIEVSPFQWQRIAAHLRAGRNRRGFMAALAPRRLAWGAAAGLLLAAAITLTGVEYRKSQEEKRLASIAAYSRMVELRIEKAGNPFGEFLSVTSDQNPFEKYQREANINAPRR